MTDTTGWTLTDWDQAYRSGQHTPETLITSLVHSLDVHDPAWISVIAKEHLDHELTRLAQLAVQRGREALPLYGIPFAIKDNIDVIGFPTTAACPDYAYKPEQDAAVVRRLKAAGAVPIGKTNLDQFATGLVGTRSPYGAVPNAFDSRVISGGSSSGSASVVARGLVPFALGTDTAGSGRVPAGLNNIVGLKPTCGAASIEGVVPACRSLDCVSVFALTVDDAATTFEQIRGYVENDPFSRRDPGPCGQTLPGIRCRGKIQTLGVPKDPQWFGDTDQQQAWNTALEQARALGLTLVEVDFGQLFELAALLYEGPWVAERHAAIRDFMMTHSDSMNPVVRGIIEKAAGFSATDTFEAIYRRQSLLRTIDEQLAAVDGLMVPTAPIAPSQEALKQEPVHLNSLMGTYTNFVNLADLAGLAVPAGFRRDGIPFGVTFLAGAWRDGDLQQLAGRWLNAQSATQGATSEPCAHQSSADRQPQSDRVQVAVVGAHLSGMPLNSQLTERQGHLLEQTATSETYRLYALPNTTPAKPGLHRVADGTGARLIVEVWDMPVAHFGSFVDLVPSPLGIGSVELADGRWVNGFICEGYALDGATDVTEYGGWRAWISRDG